MSVINNKGFVNSGVTHLQLNEKFPVEVSTDDFTSFINVIQKSITPVGTSGVYLINYSLVHTMTYRPVAYVDMKTTVKTYSIVIPLKITSPIPVGTLPTVKRVLTQGSEKFINTCGRCSGNSFNKYIKDTTLEFEFVKPSSPSEEDDKEKEKTNK